MPLINLMKAYGSDITKALDPGEELLDVGWYNGLPIGDERRLTRRLDELSPWERKMWQRGGLPHPELEPPPARFFQGFDLWDGLQIDPYAFDRILGGVSGIGGPDSIAGRLWRAGRDDMSYSAVTDRRFLLLRESKSGTADFAILFETPRTSVASIRRRGKIFFQRGRVEVRFVDGSMKAWSTGMLCTGRARSLVRALSGPGPRVGAR